MRLESKIISLPYHYFLTPDGKRPKVKERCKGEAVSGGRLLLTRLGHPLNKRLGVRSPSPAFLRVIEQDTEPQIALMVVSVTETVLHKEALYVCVWMGGWENCTAI